MWAWELGKMPVSWTWNRVRKAVIPPSPTWDLKYVLKQAVQVLSVEKKLKK